MGHFNVILNLITSKRNFPLFYIFSDTGTDLKHDILQLLNLINLRFFFGNFEIDWDSGEIRFKTNVFYHFIEPQPAWIEEIIMTNIATMGAYLPAFVAMIHENKSIEESLSLLQFEDDMDDLRE